MGASFGAEFFKLRKRPATWVLAGVLLLFVVLLGYFLTYMFISSIPQDQSQPNSFPVDLIKKTLLPENFLSNLLSGLSSLGGAIALILGALAAGSEYGWGTLKTALTQRPGRLSVFSGKLLALGAILAVFVTVAFTAAALSSYIIAQLENAASNWPQLQEIARAMGASWLIFAVWSALGLFLAIIFRSTALAIGLGLIYMLVLESIVTSLPIQNETFKTVRKALPGENARSLAMSFGQPPEGLGAPKPLIEPTQAALVLAAYTVALILAAALSFRRRDVT